MPRADIHRQFAGTVDVAVREEVQLSPACVGRRQNTRRCLLLSPVRPLFGDEEANSITLQSLREQQPDLSYFSYVHLVRTIVRRTACKLLLIAHRSQSFYLFDLISQQPTIIYCDGFYDSLFKKSVDFGFPGGERSRKRVLSEIYYLLHNGSPTFFGLAATPAMNRFLLMAGYVSLRDARENPWVFQEAESN